MTIAISVKFANTTIAILVNTVNDIRSVIFVTVG